jgi:hypothetical protein
MRKPFWLIGGRLREADFFLDMVRAAQSLDHARHFYSAFLAAAIAVRDAIDRTLRGAAHFDTWWKAKKATLEAAPAFDRCRKLRNRIQHEGLNQLAGWSRSHLGEVSVFLAAEAPEQLLGDDAVAVGKSLMTVLTQLAAEAYGQFWTSLDLSEGYSLAELARNGGTLEQIEAEFGLPARWSGDDNASEDVRLERLKVYSRTATEPLLRKYAS